MLNIQAEMSTEETNYNGQNLSETVDDMNVDPDDDEVCRDATRKRKRNQKTNEKPHSSHPGRYEGIETARFYLTNTCTLILHRGDITKWTVDGKADAIVNAANEKLLGGAGVDGAIHKAAGSDLLKACKEIPEVRPGVRCPMGSAKITKGFNLPVSHIILTVGPIYDIEEDPESMLSNAYRSSLNVARENGIKHIAFPAISCGIYGYPYDEAAAVSLMTLKEHVEDLKEVHFVLFEVPAWKAWLQKASELFEQI
eukprot:Gb_13986 [translate_table: standard]